MYTFIDGGKGADGATEGRRDDLVVGDDCASISASQGYNRRDTRYFPATNAARASGKASQSPFENKLIEH
jgi:hypothetical protein